MTLPLHDPTDTVQCAFRLPQELIDRIDAYALTAQKEMKGLIISRTDAVRILLYRALEDENF